MLFFNLIVIMKQAIHYIHNELGIDVHIVENNNEIRKHLPLFITSYYEMSLALINDVKIILLSLKKSAEQPTTGQIKKHVNTIKELLKMPVLLIFNRLEAYKRNRLIQYRVNFVVPFKQLYLPDLFVIVSEKESVESKQTGKLSPLGQAMVIFWLLNDDQGNQIEFTPYNNIAKLFETNAMAITRAIESLESLELCSIKPGRPKSFSFLFDKRNLWEKLKRDGLWIDPVQKRIFLDILPEDIHLTKANRSALAEYTDMNPTHQSCFAIDKSTYQRLKKSKEWPEEFQDEGEICVEIWKYNPLLLSNQLRKFHDFVDPLSIYFCFANSKDERTEAALEQIEAKYLWLEG